MKRLSLAIVFACCMLVVAAQEGGFRVNYQGAKPTIKDFAKAYITSLLNPEDEEPEGDGLYMYESIQKAMVCQEKGQPLEKNKTLNIDLKNGFLVYEEKDDFYRYDNATKKMSRCNTPGFDVEYLNKSYALPRTGKDITVTTWDRNGKKTQKTLKWNGHGFSY